MENPINLIEQISNVNYAALDYRQLVELELVFSWAKETIDSLIPVKKKEEMDVLTSKHAKLSSMGIDAPSEATVHPDEEKEHLSEPLSVPEEELPTFMEDDGASLWNENNTNKIQDGAHIISTRKGKGASDTKKSLVEQALALAKATPIASGIDPKAPYYMCMKFKKREDGTLAPYGLPGGWNMEIKTLKKLKVSEKAHMEGDFKNTVKTTSAGDYMVYQMSGGLFSVSYYKMTGVPLKVNSAMVPKEATSVIEFSNWIRDWVNSDDVAIQAGTQTAKANIDSSENKDTAKAKNISSEKKKSSTHRHIAIIGTKDGETKLWNSYRECERDLGVSPGTASQVVSGKMKTAKGWILKRAEEKDKKIE